MRPFKIFIGYDPREKIAFHVLSQSIIEHSSIPVSISPINLNNLKKFYKRKKRVKDSTEFSISRFLTPYLSDYKGYSLFVDCDFIIMTYKNFKINKKIHFIIFYKNCLKKFA
jgi:hypothetical protein